MTHALRITATGRIPMDAQRKTALTVGILFVLTLVFAIPGVLAYGPVLNDPFYVLGPGAGLSVSLGAFFEILTVIANIATAMVLFPLLRRQNETLALSYVAARFIEGALIVVGMLSLLAVETLRQDGAGADPDSLLVASQSLVAVHDWTFLLGPGFMSGLGNGLLLGYLIYRSGLLSRRLTMFGMIGGPLVMASGIAVLFGLIEAGSTAQGLATIPGDRLGDRDPRSAPHLQGLPARGCCLAPLPVRERGHVDRRQSVIDRPCDGRGCGMTAVRGRTATLPPRLIIRAAWVLHRALYRLHQGADRPPPTGGR